MPVFTELRRVRVSGFHGSNAGVVLPELNCDGGGGVRKFKDNNFGAVFGFRVSFCHLGAIVSDHSLDYVCV